ncbi:MAG: DUF362 domain-containing protein [Xenococcus sp. MO_188.B8]|nr:DUF362 domain-containing protein [Xenococcus sp. MO_188.B8]
MHRRKILQWTGLATGAAILPPVFNYLKLSRAAARAKAESRKLLPLAQPTGVSKVVLVHTSDRVYGTHRIFELLQPDGIKGKSVFLKPNFNTADPAPGATDPQLLEALVQELQNAGARTITVGDRSGMANTRDVMQSKGVFDLADKYKFMTVVFDDLPIDQWQYFASEGTHWKQGFAFARPILDAEAVVTTGCLKTHGGALYTLALKNTIGMIAKKVPGDKFNYMMQDLHTSPHMQKMIAEVNAVYQPRLIVMDGVEAFVDGGPASGKRVSANVMLAGTDRVAIDIVALGILRSLGTTRKISQGSLWNLEQIRRAGELGVGIRSYDQIELIAPDQESQKIADKIRPLIAA